MTDRNPTGPALSVLRHRAGTRHRLTRGSALLAGTILAAPAALAQNVIELPAIVVQADMSASGTPLAYGGGQVATGARLGALGNTEVGKSPFSIVSYTDQVVRDRQAKTVSEALAFEPSVQAT